MSKKQIEGFSHNIRGTALTMDEPKDEVPKDQKTLLLGYIEELHKFSDQLKLMEDKQQIRDGYTVESKLEVVKAIVEENFGD